jgi:hypothetical protein
VTSPGNVELATCTTTTCKGFTRSLSANCCVSKSRASTCRIAKHMATSGRLGAQCYHNGANWSGPDVVEWNSRSLHNLKAKRRAHLQHGETWQSLAKFGNPSRDRIPEPILSSEETHLVQPSDFVSGCNDFATTGRARGASHYMRVHEAPRSGISAPSFRWPSSQSLPGALWRLAGLP